MKNDSTQKNKKQPVLLVGLSLTTLFLAYMFVGQTLIPYGKMYSYFVNVEQRIREESPVLLDAQSRVYKVSYLELSIRQSLVELIIYGYQKGQLTNYSPLFLQATEQLEKITWERYPECSMCYLDIGKGYDLIASLDPKHADDLYDRAEKNYLRGLEIIPDFQTYLLSYVVNLTSQGRTNEGIALLRHSLAQDDQFPGLHYYLGLLLFQSDSAHPIPALDELEIGLSGGTNYDGIATKLVYEKMLTHFYRAGDKVRVSIVVRRLAVIDSTQAETYLKIQEWIDEHGTLPVLNFN